MPKKKPKQKVSLPREGSYEEISEVKTVKKQTNKTLL